MEPMPRFALVGPGRAGTALSQALTAAGWQLTAVAGRGQVEGAGAGADVVLLTTPDSAVAEVAAAVAPSLEPGAAVLHVAGSLGLDVFDALVAARPDVRVGSAHPLQTLGPSGPSERGRQPDGSLVGAWFAVEGDDIALELVDAVGGHPFAVTDRALYHATACVAANHLVALLGQVERLAAEAGVPMAAFKPLVDAAVENVFTHGAAASLTGPVARGDHATVERHLAALPEDERSGYQALSREAVRLLREVVPT